MVNINTKILVKRQKGGDLMVKLSREERENALKAVLSVFTELKVDDVREIVGFTRGLSSARLTEKSSQSC